MELAEYEVIRALEDVHWWYQGLWSLTSSWLERAVDGRPARLLDAGCGTGGLLARLSDRFPECVGIDVSPQAVSHCRRRGLAAIARGSVDCLPFRSESFDAIVSNDVLYHRAADEVSALREFRRVLKPGGALLMNLPAFESLRGTHDIVVHTRRRFTKPDLSVLLEQAGFRCRRISYRVSLLFPAAWAVRKLRHSQTGAPPSESDVAMPAWPLNDLLRGVLGLENMLLGFANLPIGLSLYSWSEKVP